MKHIKKDFIYTMVLILVLSGGAGFSLEPPAGKALIATNQKEEQSPLQRQERPQEGNQEGENPEDNLPTLPPPPHDPEMVIKPDAPPDPDAVVVPPPVDPEMSVDPSTREPMTKEKLEDLQQKDQSGGQLPDQKGKTPPKAK